VGGEKPQAFITGAWGSDVRRGPVVVEDHEDGCALSLSVPTGSVARAPCGGSLSVSVSSRLVVPDSCDVVRPR
jgi:hypothetical protein